MIVFCATAKWLNCSVPNDPNSALVSLLDRPNSFLKLLLSLSFWVVKKPELICASTRGERFLDSEGCY